MINYKKGKLTLLRDKIGQSKEIVRKAKGCNLKRIIQVADQNQSQSKNTSINRCKSTTDMQIITITQQLNCFKRFMLCLQKTYSFLFRSSDHKHLDIDPQYSRFRLDKIKSKKTNAKKPILPPQVLQRKVLILDLDETLIHTTLTKPSKYDFEMDVIYNGKPTKIYTVKRFGLDYFIFQMAQNYELVIFTASHKLYADQVINRIDPNNRISYRIYRENCVQVQPGCFLKNVNNIGRNIQKIILVDDSPMNGVLQSQIFYQIHPFTGEEKDYHLIRLSAFLKYISNKDTLQSIKLERQFFDQIEISLDESEKRDEIDQKTMASNKEVYLQQNQESIQGLRR